MIEQLQQNFPNLTTFTRGKDQTEQFLALDPRSLNTAAGLELVNKFVQELSRFEVVRNDLSFRILL